MVVYSQKPLPDVGALKATAKRLRAVCARRGRSISHSQALELVAKWHGARDWNTASALADKRPQGPFSTGEKVAGRYLDRPFTARILRSTRLQDGKVRLSLEFEQPMDVIASAHFSEFRSRVTGVIGPDGRSEELLSTGAPQLALAGLT